MSQTVSDARKAIEIARDYAARSMPVLGSCTGTNKRETGDISIYESYKEANSLHSNFYDTKLSLDDIKTSSMKIAELIKKLMSPTERAMKD